MTAQSRPVWLVRGLVGIAHAFVVGAPAASCGVRRESGLPWEPARAHLRRCSVCVRVLQRQARPGDGGKAGAA